MVSRVWPRHRHRGRPLNSVVRRHENAGCPLKQVAKVDFNDLDAKSPGFVLTQAEPGMVEIAISLDTNGDIEVFVTPESARAIARAIEAAANHASAGGGTKMGGAS